MNNKVKMRKDSTIQFNRFIFKLKPELFDGLPKNLLEKLIIDLMRRALQQYQETKSQTSYRVVKHLQTIASKLACPKIPDELKNYLLLSSFKPYVSNATEVLIQKQLACAVF